MLPARSSSPRDATSLFSLVYQSLEGGTLVLNDNQPATSRKVTFNMNLPQRPLDSGRRRGQGGLRTASNESLRSIDSRDEANWAYKVCYSAPVPEEEFLCPDEDELPVENSKSGSSSVRSLTWFKFLQSKLLAAGRSLHLCTQ
ncbi:hypothetical protein BKA70DRAFT_1417436 [Coprinopsis sp. MPI-PUGE-AT-0042]|nr:hypothetical protein BKA70DRAFT_1417436 [Coprinopsis sp. MPI-PUGE-AT-0042]